MAIKVQNNGGIGNPYHSEKTGEFVSAEYSSGNMKPGDVKNYDKVSDSFDDDIDWDDLFSEGDPNDELVIYWNNKQKGIVPKKNIEEMTNQEMIEEIKECKKFFDQKGIVFKNYNDFFYGDLKLKCSNFRMLKNMLEKYPINIEGCEIKFSKQFKKLRKTAYTYPFFYNYDKISGNIIMPTFKNSKSIVFNHLAFKNYNSCKNLVRTQINKGFWIDVEEGYETAQTIAHEYGHLVASHVTIEKGFLKEMAIKMPAKHYWFESREIEISNDIEFELKQMYEQKYNATEKDFEAEKSRYGKTNSKEFFAETFASLMCGKPTKTALILEEYLKQYFNK